MKEKKRWDARLKIHAMQFFKVVIYLPNLIMASAFAMLFFTMFSTGGPVNSILLSLGWVKAPIDFLGSVFGTRFLVGFMNFLMWFGNTTIMLMAAIMGISPDIFEASELDGCSSVQRFFYITLPMIRPILAYTLITSIIGGLQMFDVPQILTNGQDIHDIDHVPEQPPEEPELWYGRRVIGLFVYRKRYSMLLCISDDQ